ncbi:MAG: hypothetical protein WC789_05455 [Lentisphaeria bacterium]
MAFELYIYGGLTILCLLAALMAFHLSSHPRRWRKGYAYKLGLGYKLGDPGGKRIYDQRTRVVFRVLAVLALLGSVALGYLTWREHQLQNTEGEDVRIQRESLMRGREGGEGDVLSNPTERSLRKVLGY